MCITVMERERDSERERERGRERERERESQHCNIEVRSNIKEKRRVKSWSCSQPAQIPVEEKISK